MVDGRHGNRRLCELRESKRSIGAMDGDPEEETPPSLRLSLGGDDEVIEMGAVDGATRVVSCAVEAVEAEAEAEAEVAPAFVSVSFVSFVSFVSYIGLV